MNLPGTPSLIYLGFLLLFLPWIAIRSAARLKAITSTGEVDAAKLRTTSLYSTFFCLSLILWFSWVVGSGFHFSFFALPPDLFSALICTIGGLLTVLFIRYFLRSPLPLEQKKSLLVYHLAPQTPREWLLKLAVIALASVAEEVAYRGVAYAILWYTTQSLLLSVLISSLAFALAHWYQERRAMVAIFLFSLVMHLVVNITHSLLCAILIHALYDLYALWRISRDASKILGTDNSPIIS
ncbi:MAG: CPBP family intramembrane glutamic endopeptidase [Pirellulales bacterium]